YAVLAVFAPEDRFRADGTYTADLCGTVDKEDPNPQSNPEEPTVLPPVIDWCNFEARLRQSVREMVNVRMIVGQEFMVDALGVNFSGNFAGGEEMVRNEIAQFRAARFQFEQAEAFLAEGLDIRIGNGCLISDFYTQTEWRLLTQAVNQQSTTQFHIGSRQSYLNIDTVQQVPVAQQKAQSTLRLSAIDAHVKLISMTGLRNPVTGHCQIGERPDGDVVAGMVLSQLETKRQSNDMAAGLNIFGFDVTTTPARTYISSDPRNCDTLAQGDRGLWDEAWCSAKLAEALQEREENKTRIFDTQQKELNAALDKIRKDLDFSIDDVLGCNSGGVGGDAAFFECAQTQIDEAEECWRLAVVDPEVDATTLGWSPPAKYASFEACTESGNLNKRNDIFTALSEFRSDYLAYKAIVKSAENIHKQIQNSEDANATVTMWLGISGAAQTAADVASASLDLISCTAEAGILIFAQFGCQSVGNVNIAAQGIAGALSTAADVEIANAENEKEIKNLLLQMSELVIDADSARQTYLAKASDVGGMVDFMRRTLAETQRQRAYFATSPANDPSFRIVRDSARVELAGSLERAARIAYLAARRAEYEYGARLSASGFAISDIYRARTAQDILTYLQDLQTTTNNLASSASRDLTPIDLKVSVAQDVLLLTDDLLRSEGFTTPEAIEAERTRRFRLWVAENTSFNPDDGKPVLQFNFTTSLLDGGLFSNVISQGYDNFWLLKLSGIDDPRPGNNGVSINLISEEDGLSYRRIVMTQGGTVHMRSFAGCVFDYRLIAPAQLLGNEWPTNQPADTVTAVFNADVNDSHPLTENGYRTPAFNGQAISAANWSIELFSGSPQANLGLADMDLQQLNDIEINLSATYATRSTAGGGPSAADCARLDY
ncbi:MAG: hypothetical protein AAF633_19975, partial [Chloroflexota bacterium]